MSAVVITSRSQGPKGVDAAEGDVGSGHADPAVSACSLPAVDLLDDAVHADQVHVQARQEMRQVPPPRTRPFARVGTSMITTRAVSVPIPVHHLRVARPRSPINDFADPRAWRRLLNRRTIGLTFRSVVKGRSDRT